MATNTCNVLVPLGDLHIGYGTTNMDKLKKVIKFIADNDNALWIGMGDYIDATPPSHKNFDLKNCTMSIQDQIITCCDLLNEIKDKCLGLLKGNHENRTFRDGISPIKQMERELKIKTEDSNLGSSSIFKVKTNTKKYVIYATHGAERGYTFTYSPHSAKNKIAKLVSKAIADIYLMGHYHETFSFTMNMISDRKQLTTKHFVLTGNFLEFFDSYAEDKGYPPLETGCNAILFGKKKIRVENII